LTTDAAAGDVDRELAELAELVALVRDDPLIELDVDPELDAHVRFLALTPERQADELNSCSVSIGAIAYWTVEDGEVVRDLEAERQEWTLELAWRDGRRHESWRHALELRLATIVRPLARVRTRGRARRGRRSTLRRSPARSPGRDPEPPRRLELEAVA
jgi:hypothetical protein